MVPVASAARHPRHALRRARRRDVRSAGVRRRRDPVPPHDERGHGRHGPRQRRRASPRACATSSCPAMRRAATDDLEPHAQRRGRRLAPRRGAATSPTSTSSRPQGTNEPMGYCFPHYFVLPMYSSASSYRFRPLGPEETLMEIWSLTRYPEGTERTAPDAARGLGVRRSALAADPGAGLLEPAAPAARVCTRRASSTCACPRGPRATSRTSSGPSTASSPAFPTTSSCRRCNRSTCIRSTGRSSTSGSDYRDHSPNSSMHTASACASITSSDDPTGAYGSSSGVPTSGLSAPSMRSASAWRSTSSSVSGRNIERMMKGPCTISAIVA